MFILLAFFAPRVFKIDNDSNSLFIVMERICFNRVVYASNDAGSV